MAKIWIGNIKGPQGDTGPQGERGEKGDKGDTPAIDSALDESSTNAVQNAAITAAIAGAQATADSAAAAAANAQSTANKASSYETITLTKTDDIASVESAWAMKRADGLVWLYIQATTVATVSSATAKLFSGLPKPKRYSRAAAQMGNTNASCRVGISTDGNLYNAYTQVSAISGQPLCVNCMYFAE